MKTTPDEKEPKDAANDFITRKELASLFRAMASICSTDELSQPPSSSAIPVSLKPEFIRVHEAVKLFGVGWRSLHDDLVRYLALFTPEQLREIVDGRGHQFDITGNMLGFGSLWDEYFPRHEIA